LGSTHAAALLVKARRAGWVYVGALVMTVIVAGCAFLLSFEALRDLAVLLGWPHDWRAWLFPLAIDVSIAQATFGLLAVTPLRRAGAARGSAVTGAGNGARPASAAAVRSNGNKLRAGRGGTNGDRTQPLPAVSAPRTLGDDTLAGASDARTDAV